MIQHWEIHLQFTLEKEYEVTYDSTLENAFAILLPNKEVKFVKSHNGLYYFQPTYNNLNKNTSLVNHLIANVEENKKFFTNQQV